MRYLHRRFRHWTGNFCQIRFYRAPKNIKSQSESRVVTFTPNEHSAENVDLTVKGRSLWGSQKQISQLFGVNVSTVHRHLSSIFDSGELQISATVAKFAIVQNEGGRQVSRVVEHYNMDAIISVGYRVNSSKATQFRIWATDIISRYVEDGYVIDEDRLKDDPQALNELAGKIRELRATEKAAYTLVRDCFMIASSDFEPTSEEFRAFYSLAQDKFHYAVTKMTASGLKMDRANHASPMMGLESVRGHFPTAAEVKIGKNYLSKEELRRQHILSEQFLLYAESTALRGKSLTMAQLHVYLDDLLVFNGYELFGGYQDFLTSDANRHAAVEFKAYVQIKQLEALGLEVDLEEFYEGGYDDHFEEASKISMRKLSQLAAHKPSDESPSLQQQA